MNATILVVDDMPKFRTTLAEAAQLNGETILEAQALEEAKDRIEENDLDLVITDVRLSTLQDNRDGLEILSSAKQKNKATQVIVVTSFDMPDVNARSMEMGAFAYLERNEPGRNFRVALKECVRDAIKFREKLIK